MRDNPALLVLGNVDRTQARSVRDELANEMRWMEGGRGARRQEPRFTDVPGATTLPWRRSIEATISILSGWFRCTVGRPPGGYLVRRYSIARTRSSIASTSAASASVM
jgi:hypothetical protein